jgi:hypothetical protein
MTSVLFVEASSGGVLGGSLTGLYHLIRGMDRERVLTGQTVIVRDGRIAGVYAEGMHPGITEHP